MTLKFKDVRGYCSRVDRVSICMLETLAYENYRFISEVPDTYNDKYLYGFGVIESEFGEDNDWLTCLEFMLSETPKRKVTT